MSGCSLYRVQSRAAIRELHPAILQGAGKVRAVVRVIRRYSPPALLCDRVLKHGETSAEVAPSWQGVARNEAGADPVAPFHPIREAQSKMAAMSSSQPIGWNRKKSDFQHNPRGQLFPGSGESKRCATQLTRAGEGN